MELYHLVNELGNTGLKGEDENKELKLYKPKHFKTSKEFLKEWEIQDDCEVDEVGMNLCVYYSIREYKDEETGNMQGTYSSEFLILHQRTGTVSQIFVDLLLKEDANRLYHYLEKHCVRNAQHWLSINW
jgi:hypothetical protein